MMFSSMRIGVGFQPEPQLMFRCMVVGVKPGFMAMFFFAAPSEGLLPKVDSTTAPMHCCNMSANPFAPKCPIESTTHRFPRLHY